MRWQDEKLWADKFMPDIKAVLGMQLLGEAPYEEDALRATDLVVLRMAPVRVAVRMRKKQYAANQKYRQEFTIRSDLATGTKTELRKILSGFGDFMLYGFEAEVGNRLGIWHLIDLNVFREHYAQMQFLSARRVMPGQKFLNADNSSSFCVFRFDDFPNNLVRASGEGLSASSPAKQEPHLTTAASK